MTYIPKPETESFEAIAGAGPWRDLSDEEFADLDARFGPGLDRWYEHIDDEPKKKKAAKAAGGND